MTEGNGTAERLRQLERRLDQSESDRRDIWRAQGANQQTLAVMGTRLESLHDDLAAIAAEVRWVRRGLWAAAGTFTVFIVAVLGLISGGGVG